MGIFSSFSKKNEVHIPKAASAHKQMTPSSTIQRTVPAHAAGKHSSIQPSANPYEKYCKTFKSAQEIAFHCQSIKHNAVFWLNLANGIELIPLLDSIGIEYHIMRMQSTQFEGKNWTHAVTALPDELILGLAQNIPQYVIDLGARHCVPRTVRQGLPISRWALEEAWQLSHPFGEDLIGCTRDGSPQLLNNVNLREVYVGTKRQLKYYRHYLNPNTINVQLYALCARAAHDGNYRHHKQLLDDSRLFMHTTNEPSQHDFSTFIDKDAPPMVKPININYA